MIVYYFDTVERFFENCVDKHKDSCMMKSNSGNIYSNEKNKNYRPTPSTATDSCFPDAYLRRERGEVCIIRGNNMKMSDIELPPYNPPQRERNRKCIVCHEWKPEDEFSTNGGKRNKCLECTNKIQRQYRKKRIENGYHEIMKERDLERRVEYKKEIDARSKLRDAVKAGKIIRPTQCSICDCANKSIHAHHENYDKPLNVIWVCSTCHKREFHTAKEIS